MAITIDSKMKEIMADPKAVAVLDKVLPGLTSHKRLKLAYGMSLRAIQQLPNTKITSEALAQLEEEFAKL